MNRNNFRLFVLSAIWIIIFTGCAGTSRYMKKIPGGKEYTPEKGKALVIFMRPSGMGFKNHTIIYDITSGTNNANFVGIVPSKKKLAYQSKPGKRLFVSTGSIGLFFGLTFMIANLEKDKTYFVKIEAGGGGWALIPIHKEELMKRKKAKFPGYYKETKFVENTEKGYKWSKRKWPRILNKNSKYFRRWERKSDSYKVKRALLAEDGI